MKAGKNCLLVLLTVALFGIVVWVNGCKTEDTTDTKPIPTKNDILIYPREPVFPLDPKDSSKRTLLNTRVPEAPPQKGGSRGHCYPLELEVIDYPLRPYVQFPQGGNLSVDVRDNLHPDGNRMFSLSDSADYSLKLARYDLGQNLQLKFIYAKGKKELAVVNLPPLPSGWSEAELKWGQTSATLYIKGKKVAEVKLAAPFNPDKLKVGGWSVDQLQLTGDGQLSLDWETGYAARINGLDSKINAQVIARVFGFDSHVISLDQSKRDCPMIQLVNTGPEDRAITLSFDVHGEVTEQRRNWQQQVTVPSQSQSMVPILFPFDVQTDVYHLKIASKDTTVPLGSSKHFMYIKLRGEQAGPEKFGLHDSQPRLSGDWPDALPIHLSHHYINWFMTQGPTYVRWWNGNWGIDPDLPPEYWYWRSEGVDRAFLAGRTVYVCIQSTPGLPWMRGREYGEDVPRRQLGGDYIGGVPNYQRYRRFVRGVANRYKGKVAFYEVENEPNARNYNYQKPEDYVQTCKAVYEEVKAIDPNARVFGISGTGDFIGWMREVFELGGYKYMDGVAWHTYIGFGPKQVMPYEIDLTGKLARAKRIIAGAGKRMSIINSETGLKFANREQIDRPMSDERLAQHKSTGGVTWPKSGMSERRGGAAYIENIIVNFLAGAEYFCLMGWNAAWNVEFASEGYVPGNVDYGWFVGANKEGRRTPGHHALAFGVLTAQMESAIHTKGRAIKQDGIQGGIFPKTNGGELAVLWSTGASRTISVRSKNRTLEYVNMLGQSSTLDGQANNGFYTHTITLEEEPCYIHASSPLTRFLPSPMQSVSVESVSASQGQIKCTLQNVFSGTWQGQISFKKEPGWLISPAKRNFTLPAGGQADLIFGYKVDSSVFRGKYSKPLSISLPNGSRYLSAVTIPVIPIIGIPRLPEASSVADIQSWQPPGGSLLLNRMDQVVIGRPPDLASLKEEDDWAGPEELSAQAKIGYDDDGILVYVKVHDAHARLPQGWPGVSGSCVEFFFDFRPADGSYGPHLGNPLYDSNVHQIVVRPVIKAGQKAAIWQASASSAALLNISVDAGSLDRENYWLILRIPWSDTGRLFEPGMRMGFDVGVNGPHPGEGGRKSQIMMFGGADNYSNASQFGVGMLD